MENLIKQTRAIFSGTRKENKDRRSTLDRNTPSFRDKKRSQSWIRRQFSGKMSRDSDVDDADYAAAVAAAAYVIHSLEEPEHRDRNETTYGPDKSMNKMKSKVNDTGILPEPRKIPSSFSDETSQRSFKDRDIIKMKSEAKDRELLSESRKNARKLSDETAKQSFKDRDTKMPEKAVGPTPSDRKKTSFADTDSTDSNKPYNQELEKASERAPSMRRPPTFADDRFDAHDSKRPDTPVPKRDRLPTGWSMNQPDQIRRQTTRKPGPKDYVADAWTKEEMASIKERYERLRPTINNWEAKKKTKANLKMEKTEAKLDKKIAEAVKSGKTEKIQVKLEKRKAKAEKKHRSKIARIEEVAAGARAQAEANRRNEEFKVKEEANRIRLTGELPKKCLCF